MPRLPLVCAVSIGLALTGLLHAQDRQPSREEFPYKVGELSLDELTPGFLTRTEAAEELKLTPEQRDKVASHLPPKDAAAAKAINQLLTPEQLQRCRELKLQNIHRVMGTAGILRVREAATALNLTDEQMAKVLPLGRNLFSDRRFFRGSARDDIEEQLTAILTAEQRTTLSKQLGLVYVGPLHTARTAETPNPRDPSSMVGALRAETLSLGFMAQKEVQEHLKLTPEQIAQVARTDRTISRRFLEPFLNEQQRARVAELQWQYYRKRFGPVGPFRYREFIEPLQLTEDQSRQIGELTYLNYSLFGRTADETSAEVRAKRDADTREVQSKLAALLTREQQKKVADQIGEDYPGELASPPPLRRAGDRSTERARE